MIQQVIFYFVFIRKNERTQALFKDDHLIRHIVENRMTYE